MTLSERSTPSCKAQPGGGSIGVGGLILASALASAGLIDEYRLYYVPIFLGSGKAAFSQIQNRQHACGTDNDETSDVSSRHSPLATRYFQIRQHACGTDNNENSDASSRHSPLATRPIFTSGNMPAAPITTKISDVSSRHSPLATRYFQNSYIDRRLNIHDLLAVA